MTANEEVAKEPTNEDKERYEELKAIFGEDATLGSVLCDPQLCKHPDRDEFFELRDLFDEKERAKSQRAAKFAKFMSDYYDADGKPKMFSYSKGMTSIAKVDHGMLAHFLVDGSSRVCKIGGTLAAWTGKHYSLDPDEIKKRAIKVCEDGYKYTYYDEDADEAVEVQLHYSLTTRDRKELFDYLHLIVESHEPCPARYIDFQNGCLDIEKYMNGDSDYFNTEPDPDRYVTNIIPHDWNQNAQPVDAVDTMLDNISCNRANVRESLEEIFGHALYRDKRKIQNFPVLVGPSGNGKSTLCDFMQFMLGSENCSNVKLADFNKTYSTVHTIAGKLCNFDDDVSSEHMPGGIWSIVKSMTGGAMLHQDVKYDPNGVDFRNTATLLLATNNMFSVSSRDAGAAVQDRIQFIPCDARIRDTDKHDIDFMDKLKSEEAAEYALKLGIDGLVRLFKNKRRFSIQDESDELKEQFVLDNDTVAAWLDANDYGAWRFVNWNADKDVRVGNSGQKCIHLDPYKEYVEWCKSNGRTGALSSNKFSRYVCKKFKLTRGGNKRRMGTQTLWRAYLPTAETDMSIPADKNHSVLETTDKANQYICSDSIKVTEMEPTTVGGDDDE